MTSLTANAPRIHVVTLVDGLGAGGAERLALLVATRLKPDLFKSTLCVSRWPAPSFDPVAEQARAQVSQAGVHFLPLGRQGRLDVWVWARLERFLRREEVDVLHTHKFGSNVWGTLVGQVSRVPVIVAHEHTWSYEAQPLRCLLDRELVARGADRFIAVSREDQRRMVTVEKIDPDRTLVIPNGIPPLPSADGRDARAELGIQADAPVIGAVGTLRPQKAYHLLLCATSQLVREWPGLRVIIVGQGPEQESLELLARELDIAQTVRFVGARTDVARLISAFDVAVCCSDFEGSPLSVLEYMRAALPVVATRVGGVPDLIDHDVQGLLVPRRDPVALATAVAELLRDPDRRRLMGKRGRERQQAEFDIDVVVRRIEALYCELLRGKSPRKWGKTKARTA